MVDASGDETRRRDVEFITTQMGRDVPVTGGYIFLPKDKERRRFRCRTRRCHATVTLMTDADGPYYTNVVTHDHPTHDEVVKEMRHKQELRLAAKARSSQHTPTQQVAIDVRLKTKTSRRLSTDARFIRRRRQNGHPPKTPSETVFDDNTKAVVLFHTDDKSIIIFGSAEMVRNATATTMIFVDGTFSRCPTTHFQLVTFHAVCGDGFSFSFAFALLPDKKSSSYLRAFNELDNIAMREFGRRLFGRKDVSVSCDFERGLLKALGCFPCDVRC